MSRVGVRREHEGVVLRTTVVPRLAKPARHAPYAPDGELFSFGGRKKGPGCPRFTPARPLFALTVAPGVKGRPDRYAAGPPEELAPSRVPRLPRWLRQPRHVGRAWYYPFTLASGSDPRHESRVALLAPEELERARSLRFDARRAEPDGLDRRREVSRAARE